MELIGYESAMLLAKSKVDEISLTSGDEFDLLLDKTKEIERGWVFFFNTADFVKTKDPQSALAGNGPIFVSRRGEVLVLPSSISWEEAVRKINDC